jgi:hypothetical protein
MEVKLVGVTGWLSDLRLEVATEDVEDVDEGGHGSAVCCHLRADSRHSWSAFSDLE